MSLWCLLQLFTTMSSGNAQIGKPAPVFKATAVVDGQFKEISLSDYKGNMSLTFLKCSFCTIYSLTRIDFPPHPSIKLFFFTVCLREVCGLLLLPLGLYLRLPH